MASEIRVNNIKALTGLGTVTISSDGINVGAGIITANNFKGGVELTSGSLTGISTIGVTTITATTLTVNGNAYPSAGPLSNRNLVINGAMRASQRNGTNSVSETGSGQYTLDRWQVAGFAAAGVFSVQQSTDTPTGYINSLKVTVTTSSASSNVDESYQLQQHIEGLNCGDLAFGSSGAKTVTLSFWVKSSVTGTMGGVIRNSDYNRTYPYEYTISSANTWERKTVTIPGDTSGTWLVTNGIGLTVCFGFGAGTNRRATAGTWANTVARIPTGSTQLIATNDATWFVTGVQLEVGSVATPFEHRSYGDELARCQRYYCLIADGNNKAIGTGGAYTAGNSWAFVHLPVEMRAAPSLDYVSGTGYYTMVGNNSSDGFNELILEGQTTSRMARLSAQANISLTQGLAYFMQTNNASAKVAFSAEL